jgi:hypothetical protein
VGHQRHETIDKAVKLLGLGKQALTCIEVEARVACARRSWATDAHKVLNVPYDSGVALCRQPHALRRAMDIGGAYLESGQQRTTFQPGRLGPELSRRARGFALWAALRQLGAGGVSELVLRYAENARSFARALDGRPSLRVVNDVCFNQVVIQAQAPVGAEPAAWTTHIVRALQAEGTCYATPSFWHGRPVIRFSFCNATTTERDAQLMAGALLRVAWPARAAPSWARSFRLPTPLDPASPRDTRARPDPPRSRSPRHRDLAPPQQPSARQAASRQPSSRK